MPSGSKSSQYSNESQTTEVHQASQKISRAMTVCLAIQALSTLILVIVSLYSFSKCVETKFSGWTVVIGIILFGLNLATVYANYSKMPRCLVITVLLGLLVGIMLLLHEIASWNCTQEMNAYKSSFCENFRSGADTCRWLPKKKISKIGTEVKHAATYTNSSKFQNSTIADFYQPVFTVERAVLLTMSTVSLFCSLVALVLIIFVIKTGKPVYLNRKRHKNSIVVGKPKNADLANKHKTLNLIHTKTTAFELENYHTIRSKIFHEHGTNLLPPKKCAETTENVSTTPPQLNSTDNKSKSKKIDDRLAKTHPKIKKSPSHSKKSPSPSVRSSSPSISPKTSYNSYQ